MARRRRKKKKDARPSPVPLSEPAETRAAGSKRLFPPLLAVPAVLALFAVLFFFWRGRTRGADPRPLNVVLVTTDTLRADRLGAYGATSVATPNLDRLAAEGVVFESARTAVPITLPSHASIFTGTYPLFHGVRENGGRPLSPESTTLAETLKSAGYATGAFVGAFVLDARFGLAQGFDHYDDDLGDASERRGSEVLDDALAWMDSLGDARFFSWIHLFDPHVPYDPPEPFRSRYGPTPAGLYDGEVAYVDQIVGRLLDWLDARGLAESTLVVFTSDHGESLGEHGELTHGFFVYGATMQVPLLLRSPNLPVSGTRVSAQVRTIDVAPTILELVGVEPPPEVQGVSLVALASGRTDDLGLEAYGESWMPRHYGWSELRSLRDGAYQYIEAPRPELYDVVEDPDESDNLAPTRAATVRDFREKLRQIQEGLLGPGGSEPPETAVPVDPDAVAKLTALGYLGSAASPRVDPEAVLPDPKDKIALFNRIREAAAAADAGAPEEALSLLEAAVAEDPAVVETRNAMGQVLLELGEPERAVSAYRDAVALDPTYVPALLGLAQAYHALGRDADAAAGLERVLELAPGTAPAAVLLARIHVDAGRGAEALRVLDRELAAAPDTPGAHYVRAVVMEREGNFDGAIAEYEKELKFVPQDYRAHFDLAKLLAQRGRGREMLEHLEKSIEANPRFAPSRLYFANALLESGEPARAVEEAREGLALDPEPVLAPFGHFILADAYQQLGRREEAARELARAQELQRRVAPPPR